MSTHATTVPAITQITSLYSDRALTVLEAGTLEVYIEIMRPGVGVVGITVPRDKLLAALGAEEAAMRVLALAELRKQRDQAQVDALADAIRSDPDLDPVEGPYAAAERLVRQGWTKAEASR